MREDEEAGGRTAREGGAGEGAERHPAEIARALAEVVSELREVNGPLRAVARSRAQRAAQKRPQPGS